jgi:branched-chain amino acid transport system substrate-binding protein
MKLRLIVFVVAVTAVALLAGSAFAQQPIRIGAINPYSGPLALYGDELTRGYQLAVNEQNAKGGVLGRKIELIRGDAGNPLAYVDLS